jgi:lipopolysaccharide/colanic/teichoic acid biosynthesis glycosyltransferase
MEIQRSLKRWIDILSAFILLILLSPFLVVISIAIRLDSSGPIIFLRRVLGVDGREFDALKFRTMIVNADEWLQDHPELWAEYQANIKLKDDPRITRVGQWLRKLSLDELPQLVNVLRGEMSLVGPRMISPDELVKYGDVAQQRLTVRPGITGLWQVSGRQDVSYDERIRLDLAYINNWSIWLDLKILLQTIPTVLGRKGAY